MPEPLRVVDQATGELVIPGCKSCHDLAVRKAGLEEDLQNEQDENTRLRRAVAAMKRDRAAERQRHKHRQTIEAVFRDWQEVLGKHRSKLTPERFDVIAARLADEYTAEHFHLAAVGARDNHPWPAKRGQEPLTEIAVYAKRGDWLESFARAGAYAVRARGSA